MQKRYFLSIIFVFYVLPYSLAQSKRALVIGINDYFKFDDNSKSVVRDPLNSLFGSVNDAKAVKELLTTRFGFNEKYIKELYSKNATQENILNELDKLLLNSKAGDNVFFYYSGHGIQLKNVITKSTDEAIAPTDVLYKQNGFIKTLQLASIFNKFVDKKVTLTTIFDCCYSWGTHTTLGNNKPQTDFNFLISLNEPGREEILSNMREHEYEYVRDSLGEIIGIETRAMDFKGYLQSSGFDTDTLYQLNKRDSSYYIFLFSDYLRISSDTIPTLYRFDSSAHKYIPIEINDEGEKEFKIQFNLLNEIFPDAISPSRRVQSNYLFLSATNDVQKASEKKDENGNKHGVFTKAIIEVLKQNPSTITSEKLFEKISVELKKRYYTQTPTLKCDPQRLKKNLLSIPTSTISSDVFAKCIQSNNNSITLDKGALSGFSLGNILQDISNPNVEIEITELKNENNSIAKIIKGSGNFKGKIFKVKDWYVKTKPLIKVYIPHDNFTTAQFSTLIQTKITPLIKEQDMNGIYKGFGYYVPFEENFDCSKIYVSGKQITYIGLEPNTNTTLKDLDKITLQNVNKNQPYIIYLPVPEEIAKATEQLLKLNQNIELVSQPEKADVSIACFYSRNINMDKDYLPNSKKINPAEPYYRKGLAPKLKPTDESDVNIVLALTSENVSKKRDSKSHKVTMPFLIVNTKVKDTKDIAKKVYNWFVIEAAKKGIWLNNWPKK